MRKMSQPEEAGGGCDGDDGKKSIPFFTLHYHHL